MNQLAKSLVWLRFSSKLCVVVFTSHKFWSQPAGIFVHDMVHITLAEMLLQVTNVVLFFVAFKFVCRLVKNIKLNCIYNFLTQKNYMLFKI